jgi:hypothetical protein
MRRRDAMATDWDGVLLAGADEWDAMIMQGAAAWEALLEDATDVGDAMGVRSR